tara:strand:- start:2054 stop:2614 length:561 start_codon:yes stop_codon:yes gene_type:complete
MPTTYTEAPTRLRKTGAADKIALMEAMAEESADSLPFAEFVLYTVRTVGNDADEQIACWARFCEGLPYRREQNEVYRSVAETVGLGSDRPLGGDCDDIVIVFVAGCLSLGLPAKVQILCDQDGWGFHVRALVGMPPYKPTHWVVVDPVWESEKQWAMKDKPAHLSALANTSPASAAYSHHYAPDEI